MEANDSVDLVIVHFIPPCQSSAFQIQTHFLLSSRNYSVFITSNVPK